MSLKSYFLCYVIVVVTAPTIRGYLVPYTLGGTTIMIDASEMPAMPSPLRQHIMGGLAKRLDKSPVSIKSSQVHNILPPPTSEKKTFLFGSEEDIPVYHTNREILQYRSDLQYPMSGSVEFNSAEPDGQAIPIEYGFDLSSAGKYVENKADATGVSYDFVGDGQGNLQVNILNSNENRNRINSNPDSGNGLSDSNFSRRKTRKPVQTGDDKHSYNELRIRTTDPPPSLVSLTVTPNLFGELKREFVNREYSGVSVKHLVQDQLNSGHGNDDTMDDVYVNRDPVYGPSVATKFDSSQILDDVTHEQSGLSENDGYSQNTDAGLNLIGYFQDEPVAEPEIESDNDSPDFFDGAAPIRNRKPVNYFPARPSSQNNHLNPGFPTIKRNAATGPNNYNVYDYTTLDDFQRVPPLTNDVNYFEPDTILVNPTLQNKQSNRQSIKNPFSEVTGIVEEQTKEKSQFVSIDNFIKNKKEPFYKPAVEKNDKNELHLPMAFIEKIYNNKEDDSDLSKNTFPNEDHISNNNLAQFNSPSQMQKRLADFNNAVFSAKVGDPVLSEEIREKSVQNAAAFERLDSSKNPRFSLTQSHSIGAIDSVEELRLINDVRQIVASLKQDEEFSPSFQSSHVLLANAMSYPDDKNHFTYKQEGDKGTMDFQEPETETDNRIQTQLMQLLLHSAAGQASKDRLAAAGHYLSNGQLHNIQALITGQSLLSGQSPTAQLSSLAMSPPVQNNPESSQAPGRPLGGISFVEQFVNDRINQGDNMEDLTEMIEQLVPESPETDQREPGQSGLQQLVTKQPGFSKPSQITQSEQQSPIASEAGSEKPTRTESQISKPTEMQSGSIKPMLTQLVTQKPLSSSPEPEKPTEMQSGSIKPMLTQLVTQEPLSSGPEPEKPTEQQSESSASQEPPTIQTGSQQPATAQTTSMKPTEEEEEVEETTPSIPPLSGTFLPSTSAAVTHANDPDPPMEDVLVEYGGSLHAASPTLMDKGTCRCGLRFAQKVVGGKAVSISEFPWLAGLARSDTDFIFCGASFVSDRHLVTAAHCVTGLTPSAIYVRAGEARRQGPATKLQVKAIRLHDRYDPYEKDFDIAVVTLQKPVQFSPSIMPICLPSHKSPAQVFRSAVVAGWGRTREGANVSATLRAATVDLLTGQQCREQSSYKKWELNDRIICARAPGKDACQGDSGGPLMVAHGNHIEMIGLVSWGIGCADERYPGIYTKVNLYKTWIKASTRTGSKCSNVPIGDVQTSRASVVSYDKRLNHNIGRVPSPFGALSAYLIPALKASFDNQQKKLLLAGIRSTPEVVFKGNEETVPSKGTPTLLNVVNKVGDKLISGLSPDGELLADRSSLKSETTVLPTGNPALELETTVISTDRTSFESPPAVISTDTSPVESQINMLSTESSTLELETVADTLEMNDANLPDNQDTDSNNKSDATEISKDDNLQDKTADEDSAIITLHNVTVADPNFNFTLGFEDINMGSVSEQGTMKPLPTTVTEMNPSGSLVTISDLADISQIPVQKNMTKLDIDSIEAIVQSYSDETAVHSPHIGALIHVSSPQVGATNPSGSVRPLVAQTSKPITGNEVRENGTIMLQHENVIIADPSFNFTLDYDNSSNSVASTPALVGVQTSNQKRSNGTIVLQQENITISEPNFNFTLDFDDIHPTIVEGEGQSTGPIQSSKKNASSGNLITLEDITISQPNFNFTLGFDDIEPNSQVGGGQVMKPNQSSKPNASSESLIILEDITIASPGFNFTLDHEDVPEKTNKSSSTTDKTSMPQNGTLMFETSNVTISDPKFRFSLDFSDLTSVEADINAGSDLKTRVRSSDNNFKRIQHSLSDIDTQALITRDKGEKINGGLLENFSGMIIDSIHKLDNYLEFGNVVGSFKSNGDSTLKQTTVTDGESVSNHNEAHSSAIKQNQTTSNQTVALRDKVSNTTGESSDDQLTDVETVILATNSSMEVERENKTESAESKDIYARIAEVQSEGVEETPTFYRLLRDNFGGWMGRGHGRARINDKLRTEKKPEDDLNDAINKIYKHSNSEAVITS